MKKLSKYKIVSIILTIAVCLSLVPLSVFAVNPQAPLPETPEISAELLASLPETLDADAIAGKGHISRLYAEETDLNSVVFDNGNGAQSVYIFGEDIKYIDKDGKTRDKSNKLQSVTGGYTNPYNDIQVFYPTEISSGITVNYKDYTVNMVPMPDISSNEMSTTSFATLVTEDKRTTPDAVKYNNVFGANTAVEYIQQFTGFKEIITVEEYTGQTEFAFMITTNGLTLALNEGTAELTDPATGSMVGKLGDLVMWDSIDAYYTGEYTIEEIKPNDIYVVVIDATEILTNPDTVYPVFVDPAVYLGKGVNSDSFIDDTVIYSGSPNTISGGWGTLDVGNVSTLPPVYSTTLGIGYAFFKFPTLISDCYYGYSRYDITAVQLSVTGCGQPETLNMNVYFCKNSWQESTLKYSNSNWPNCKGELVNEFVTVPDVEYPGSVCRMDIDITYAWAHWMRFENPANTSTYSGYCSSQNGLILEVPTHAVQISSAEDTTVSSRPYIILQLNSYDNDIDMIYKLKNKGASNNTGSDYYLHIDGALDNKNTNVLATTITSDSNGSTWKSNYAKNVRIKYDEEYDGFRIHPICSNNGTYRVLSVDQSNNNNIELYDVATKASTRYDDLFQFVYISPYECKIVKMNDPSSANTSEQVLTVNPQTKNIYLATFSEGNNYQLWYIKSDYEYYAEQEYYRRLNNVYYPISDTVDNYNKITSGYGYRTLAIDSDGEHPGMDIGVNLETPVLSMWSGTVLAVAKDGGYHGGRGNYVVVQSNLYNAYGQNTKLVFIYMHLATVADNLQVGSIVTAEQELGTVGETGSTTAPHLHVNVLLSSNNHSGSPAMANTIDPLLFFVEEIPFEG